jgi:hypothetical protein
MAGVFQNIDPPPTPLSARRVCTLVRGEDTLARGVGVNILEDVRHSSVLYVCKYFAGIGLEQWRSMFFCKLFLMCILFNLFPFLPNAK